MFVSWTVHTFWSKGFEKFKVMMMVRGSAKFNTTAPIENPLVKELKCSTVSSQTLTLVVDSCCSYKYVKFGIFPMEETTQWFLNNAKAYSTKFTEAEIQKIVSKAKGDLLCAAEIMRSRRKELQKGDPFFVSAMAVSEHLTEEYRKSLPRRWKEWKLKRERLEALKKSPEPIEIEHTFEEYLQAFKDKPIPSMRLQAPSRKRRRTQ